MNEELQFPLRVADVFDGAVLGSKNLEITHFAKLENAGEGSLSFCATKEYAALLKEIRGATLFTKKEFVPDGDLQNTFLVVDHPQREFARFTKKLQKKAHARISPSAEIDASAEVGDDVSIGSFAIVGPKARIGSGSIIGAHSIIDGGVTLGKECELQERVTVLAESTLGDRVKVSSGTVIGSDGFGFVPAEDGSLEEVPQIGTVTVEDDVRIGANCTIDRAALGETLIGARTKIDNLVHIAHNCQIGKDCIICGATAISGSVVLEDRVTLGGQVGLGPHLTVGSGAVVGSQSGTTTNLKGDQTYWSTPSIPVKESLSIIRYSKKLPELFRRVKKLERDRGE